MERTGFSENLWWVLILFCLMVVLFCCMLGFVFRPRAPPPPPEPTPTTPTDDLAIL